MINEQVEEIMLLSFIFKILLNILREAIDLPFKHHFFDKYERLVVDMGMKYLFCQNFF